MKRQVSRPEAGRESLRFTSPQVVRILQPLIDMKRLMHLCKLGAVRATDIRGRSKGKVQYWGERAILMVNLAARLQGVGLKGRDLAAHMKPILEDRHFPFGRRVEEVRIHNLHGGREERIVFVGARVLDLIRDTEMRLDRFLKSQALQKTRSGKGPRKSYFAG